MSGSAGARSPASCTRTRPRGWRQRKRSSHTSTTCGVPPPWGCTRRRVRRAGGLCAVCTSVGNPDQDSGVGRAPAEDFTAEHAVHVLHQLRDAGVDLPCDILAAAMADMPEWSALLQRPVSYTHLRAHETDSY